MLKKTRKSKRGGKIRGPRMTREERLREAKRKELMREIELGALNTERYRRVWREALMRAKMPDIQKNTEIAWHTFERALDLKDFSIDFLMDGLDEAEEQCRRNERSQAEAIDRLLRIHEERLRSADGLFHWNLHGAIADRACEHEKIGKQRSESETLLRKIALLANRNLEEALMNARSAAISKVDAFAEDRKNERRVAVSLLENRLQNLWQELRGVLSDYRQDTEERRKLYEVLEERDEADRRMITRQYHRIANLIEEIGQVREKIATYETQVGKELRDVARESHFFREEYRKANQSFISDRRKDQNRVALMSMEYNNTMKHLKVLTSKAERILTYVQICRKYETQDEKILPPVVNEATLPTQLSRSTSKTDTFCLDQISEDFSSTFNFWRRLGSAQLIALELRTERDELLSKSDQLRELLKSTLSSVSHTTQFADMC